MMPVSVQREWWCYRAIVCCCALLGTWAEEFNQRKTIHDDPFAVYPYHLISSSPFGRISDTALPGSEVPVDKTLPHFQDRLRSTYLKLQLLPTVQEIRKHNETTTQAPPMENTPRDLTLPPNLMVDMSGEEGNIARVDEKLAFAVDDYLNIVVDNPEHFQEVDEIAFWVVAIRRGSKGRSDAVVSNPLAFVIRIDHEEVKRKGAAVYVGIVVLAVCIFVLLIPLTVRTKRRLREGKPVFACGSSRKKLEKRMRKENESLDQERRESIAVIFDGRPRANTEAHEHETFQSKNMRSVSEHHFQPRWLDPHYKDVYEHPRYEKNSSVSHNISYGAAPAPAPASASASNSKSKSKEQNQTI